MRYTRWVLSKVRKNNFSTKCKNLNVKKNIIGVRDTLFAVAKRKPEKNRVERELNPCPLR